MNILLIQPPYHLYDDDQRQAMPPLGLAYIAAALEQAGHQVRILDCVVEGFNQLTPMSDNRRRHGLSDAQIFQAIAEYQPRLVGVSCLFTAQASAAHNVCRLVKQVDPRIITIMGGAHPSAVPENVLNDKHVDFAAIGEGEQIVQRLADALAAGQKMPDDPSGLAWREGETVQVRRPKEFIHNLDAMPLPARHLLPMRDYFKYRAPHGSAIRRHPVTNIITSRGCPARCSFCSIHTVWGRRFRWNSSERVLAEIEHLVEHYGVRELQFEDDNLTLHKPRTIEICRGIIDRKIDITWTTPNGVALWALNENILELMRRAGCHHVALAVESGSPRVLKEIINKPLDLKRVPPLIKACRKIGMGVSVFFVVGFPGETRAEIQQTFDYAMSLGVDQVNFFTATPYPGTALFRNCIDQNLLTHPLDYTQLRVGRPIISTEHWTASELQEMVHAAQARFYKRTLLRRPTRIISLGFNHFVRDPKSTLRKMRQVFFNGKPEAATSSP